MIKTYGDLLESLLSMGQEELDQDITIHTPNDEYVPATFAVTGQGNDTLDSGHLVISVVNDEGNIIDEFFPSREQKLPKISYP